MGVMYCSVKAYYESFIAEDSSCVQIEEKNLFVHLYDQQIHIWCSLDVNEKYFYTKISIINLQMKLMRIAL